ncbi:hypothetical protein FZW96_15450 [Bacillus sp. BGMRC 2118]|nr:hypothetical protein FZW96_15450 [Bacillus sp. BGMRC 2118]
MYGLCCKYQGKVVRIREHNGREHIGRISRVSPNRVFIEPTGPRGGFGYGFYGGGYYRGYGAYSLALGAIAGIALAGLFFW